MAFVLPGDPAVKDTTKASYPAAVNDALADLNSRLSAAESSVLPNGSFEFDLDIDGEPDGWTVTDALGGTHSISTSSIHGAKALQINTTVGGGNAEALSDTFVSCGEDNIVNLAGFAKRSVASIRVRLQVLYYNKALTLVATDVAYADVGTSTAWVLAAVTSEVPTGAFFYKVKALGGAASDTIAGFVLFDGLYSSVLLRGGFAFGEYIWADAGAEGSASIRSESGATPVKLWEWATPKGGEIRVRFTLGNTGGGGSTARGQVYRNGVAAGAIKSQGTAGSPGVFSDDVSGWVPGDLVQLYGWDFTGTAIAEISNGKLKSSLETLGKLPGRLDV